MAIIKLSASKKALTIITDDGVVYTMAISMMQRMLQPGFQQEFIVLTRMPQSISADRFPKSPIYQVPGDVTNVPVNSNIKPGEDYMSGKKPMEPVKDSNIWEEDVQFC